MGLLPEYKYSLRRQPVGSENTQTDDVLHSSNPYCVVYVIQVLCCRAHHCGPGMDMIWGPAGITVVWVRDGYYTLSNIGTLKRTGQYYYHAW